ncbi:MAG: acriflavin resistance protein [Desulfobacteraceae bacterium 4572_35.2]|nr:MAG: acriflavin resistance protein [Desulfobacteraceae bacterium 4572_35.2]
MKNFINLSLKQTVFINVVFIILMVGGVYSVFHTPVENLPPVAIGKVFITTVHYGASAEDVEQLVTREIEDAIDGLEHVEYVQSTSMRNVSSILVKFIDDTDYRHLYDELRLRVLNMRNELPDEVDDPIFTYLDSQEWKPVIVANLVGELSNASLTLLAEELKSDLRKIDGVQEVELHGDYHQEFQVHLDPDKLRSTGVSFTEVGQAISDSNIKIPSGRYRQGGRNTLLDTGHTFASQQRVLDVAVRRDGDGNFIRVRDLIYQAGLNYRDPDIISTVNGLSTVSLKIKKQDSANAITIAERVKSAVEQFNQQHHRDGVKTILTNDSTIEIDDSVRTLGGNMVLGMILVTLVLWLTLGFRNAMLTAIGIPFSFLVTIIIVKLTGQSINTISLFSFVLVSGIIVDDAVIIIENIYRHLYMGKTRRTAVVDGVSEVFLPVISSAMTTIFAFAPMLIMTGSTGDFFSVIPKAVSFALFASLVESLFILPIHVLDYGPRQIEKNIHAEGDYHHLQQGPFAPAWKIYRSLLDKLLNHKVIALGGVAAMFFIALTMMALSASGRVPLIKVKFYQDSYLRYHVAVQMPTGTSAEGTDHVVRELSKYLIKLGPQQTLSTSGTAGMMEDRDYQVHRAQHYGQVVVELPSQEQMELPTGNDQIPAYIDQIRDQLESYVDLHHHQWAGRPELLVFGENTGPPAGKAVNIRLTAPDIDAALAVADLMMENFESDQQGSEEFSDLVNLEDNRAEVQSVLTFNVKRDRALEYGLTSSAATQLIAGALNGMPSGQFRTTTEEIDLMVKLARQNGTVGGLSSPVAIAQIPIIEHSQKPILIGDIATIRYRQEPDTRTRYNGKPTITITADIRDGSTLSASRVQVLAQQYFSSITAQHPGVGIAFGGEFESTNRAYTSLAAAFIIAVLAIYLILATQFNDYVQPIIILSAIPFAFIGVVFGLFLTRSVFTVGSFMAVIGLAGVAVNDSLILIDFMNKERRRGVELRQSVINGCSARMRPVLITTVTTMLGMLPMAIGIPHKSITWAPMATAFATGLISATTLALLIIPVEFELAEKIKDKLSGVGHRRLRNKARKNQLKDNQHG